MALTAKQTARLEQMIAADDADDFYSWKVWRDTAVQVKRMDSNECQRCKALGKYKRGELVHHVKHLKDRPDLALQIKDPSDGTRQLVTLCRDCHAEEHPERQMQYRVSSAPLTAERWD